MKRFLCCLGFLASAVGSFAAPAPYPVTINSQAASAPAIELNRAETRTLRVTFKDGAAASNIGGHTPWCAWYTSQTAVAVSTAACTVVSASNGVVDCTFSASALNYPAGRYYYGVGVTSNSLPTVYRQGVLTIQGSPYTAGAAAVTWTTNWNLDLFTISGTLPVSNLPSTVLTNVFGAGTVSVSGTGRTRTITGTGVSAGTLALTNAAIMAVVNAKQDASTAATDAEVAGHTNLTLAAKAHGGEVDPAWAAVSNAVRSHVPRTDNPHAVTAAQVGAYTYAQANASNAADRAAAASDAATKTNALDIALRAVIAASTNANTAAWRAATNALDLALRAALPSYQAMNASNALDRAYATNNPAFSGRMGMIRIGHLGSGSWFNGAGDFHYGNTPESSVKVFGLWLRSMADVNGLDVFNLTTPNTFTVETGKTNILGRHGSSAMHAATVGQLAATGAVAAAHAALTTSAHGGFLSTSQANTSNAADRVAATNDAINWVKAQGYGTGGGGTPTTASWVTNDLYLNGTNLTYALASLPSVVGRRMRVVNMTTNTSGVRAVISAYAGSSAFTDRLTDPVEINLSRARSASNSAANATTIYVKGLNALNGSMLHVDDGSPTRQIVELSRMSSAVSSAWAISTNGAGTMITCFCEFRGKLYAGQQGSAGQGDVLVYDAGNWSRSFDGADTAILSLCVHNDRLIAGQGDTGAGSGDIYSFDGSSWTLIYSGPYGGIYSLCSWKGGLYFGEGWAVGNGNVSILENGVARIIFDGAKELIYAIYPYKDKLFIGQGDSGTAGDIYTYDGTTCVLNYDGSGAGIRAFCEHNGRLFAAVKGSIGSVLVLDDVWSVSYTAPVAPAIYSLLSYNGKLYAGEGWNAGDGNVVVFDNVAWSTSYDGAQEGIWSLGTHRGSIFAGQGYGSGDGDIYTMTTVQALTVTPALTHGHTNFPVAVINQAPVGTLATNRWLRLQSDTVGSQATNQIRVITEVMQ